jgi:four helix bundle protein
MKEQKFRKLEVWNKAMGFIEDIYRLTEKLPEKERYGLTSQLRKAVISIALNIAEGSGAGSDAEFKRFLSFSLRSSYEVMCAAEIAHRLRYCDEKELAVLLKKSDELSAMLVGLKKKLTTED